MGLYEHFPYTNFHELNLDWFLTTFRDLLTEWEAQKKEFSDLNEAWLELRQFVNNYFDDLNVQSEINEKLDDMAESGELGEILQPLIDDFESSYNSRLSALSARIDAFEQLTPGSTTGDAELIDARINYQGLKYTTAGSAIRGTDQTFADSARARMQSISTNLINPAAIFANIMISSTDGSESASDLYWATDYIPVIGSLTYSLYCYSALNDPASYRIAVYNSSREFIGRLTQRHENGVFKPFTIPAAGAYVRINGTTPLSPEGYMDPDEMYFGINMTFISPSDVKYPKYDYPMDPKAEIAAAQITGSIETPQHKRIDGAIIDVTGVIVRSGVYSVECWKVPANTVVRFYNNNLSNTHAFFNGEPDIGSQSHNSVRHAGPGSNSGLIVSPSIDDCWLVFFTDREFYDAYMIAAESNNMAVVSNVSAFKNIGAVGDSFTAGTIYEAGSSEHRPYPASSWPAVMSRKYGVPVANYGASGATTHQYITRSEGLPALLADDPKDLYILCLGLNDVTREVPIGTEDDINDDYLQNPDTYIGNYARIIAQIMEHAPSAKLVIMQSFWTRNINSFTISNYYSKISSANSLLAEHFGIALCDTIHSKLFNSGSYYNNWIGFHPTAPQYAAMADEINNLIGRIMIDDPYFYDYKNE